MDLIVINKDELDETNLRHLKTMEEIYTSYRRECIILYTKNREHTIRMVRYYSHLSEIDNIVAVGSERTLNSVINGMVNSNKGLIIVPHSNNSFYQTVMNIEEDFLCDIGKVNEEYFIESLSIGIDSSMINYQNFRPLMKDFKSFDIKLENSRDIVTDNIMMITFCNPMYYDKGLKISSSASLEDGMFDVYLIKEAVGMQMLFVLTKLMLGLHEKEERIHHFKTNGIIITTPKTQLYSFDREIRYANEINLSLEKQNLLIKKDFKNEIKKLTKSRF